MKKVRNAILSVVLTLCMTVPTITVYADDTSNAQADTEESATETNQIVTEENTDTEAVEEAEEVEEAEQQTENTETDIYEAERKNMANSWRYENGEKIEQLFARSARAFREFTTWPTVSGMIAKGIDVSQWNGSIDWQKAKNAGVDYAIIRCGYGMNQTNQDDSKWIEIANACTKYNIPFGVYIYSYATDTARAKSEAEHVLRLIKGYNLKYPVYYDLEDESIRKNVSEKTVGDIAQTFYDTITAAGYKAAMYANTDWFSNYLTDSRFTQWDKWVAQYNTTCTYGGKYQMWQCSSKGSVDGINGNVDLNIDFGASDSNQNNNAGVNVAEGTYSVSTALNADKICSVSGGSLENGASIVLARQKNTSEQRFEISSAGNGWYRIISEKSGKAVDIPNGSAAVNVGLHQYDWNGSNAQLWRFEDAGNGYYYIKAKTGTYLEVRSSNASDGVVVQTAAFNKSDAQKWKLNLSEYHPLENGIYTIGTNSDGNMLMDVSNGSAANGANIQLYRSNGTFGQQYAFNYIGNGYYRITPENSNKALEISNGSETSGANVQQSGWSEKKWQLWKLVDAGDGTYYIKSKIGTTLAIYGGNATNGTNVQAESMNYSAGQKWKINPLSGQLLQPVKDGDYVLVNTNNSREVVSQVNGNVRIECFTGNDSQKYRIEYVKNGYYRIVSKATGKVLDVESGSADSGANIQEYTWNGSDAQLWRFGMGNNGYYIKSKLGTFIDVKAGKVTEGNNVQTNTYGATGAQNWKLDSLLINEEEEKIADGTYTIASTVKEKNVLDIYGGNFANGTNVQIYASNNTAAQRYEIKKMKDGYYRIMVEKTGKVLDVKDISSKEGVNLQQYEWNGNDSQLWKFIRTGTSSYYIKSKLGTTIQVSSEKCESGSNVEMGMLKETSDKQKWTLTRAENYSLEEGTYAIKSALDASKMLDIACGSAANGANVQIYLHNGTTAQQFKILHAGNGFYKIISEKTGKSLDVYGGNTKDGSNIQQYTWNGSDAQLWKIINLGNGQFYIRAKLGKGLDVCGGNSLSGTNVQLYSSNGSKAQNWVLKKLK